MEKELINIEKYLSYLSEIEEAVYDVASGRMSIPDIEQNENSEKIAYVEDDLPLEDGEFYEDCHKALIEEELKKKKEEELENVQYDFQDLCLSLSKIIDEAKIGIYKNLVDEANNVFSLLDEDYTDMEYRLRELNIIPSVIIDILETLIENINQAQLCELPKISSPNLIHDLNEGLLNLFSKYPELIYEINPRLFEKLIAEIFRKMKLDVMLTKSTRDGGYDIVAIEDNHFTRNKYIIECKRYNKENKVGINYVQRLYGIKQDLRVSKALLITSSSFSKDAWEFARQHIWDIELKDFNDITKWLRLFWS